MKKRKVLTAIAATAASMLTAAAVALCIVFPNKYSQTIDAAADEFGVDRALVRSVVWAESKFEKDATSRSGACGLMQLMPDTYKQCATALGIEGGADGIYSVENSLRCGCYYLSLLLEKYEDETAALMAYNAGEANADKFLAGEKVFGETERYIENVALAKSVYGFVGKFSRKSG